MNLYRPETFEPDPDIAWLAARSAAEEEFREWQAADYDRREFEDFSNWLVNKARWNPAAYADALDWAERTRVEMATIHRGHRSYNREFQ